MSDDSSIIQAFQDAQARSSKEGFVPVLVAVDEPLWECPIMNSDKDSEDSEGYAFDATSMAQYRKEALAPPIKDGKVVLDGLLHERRKEAGDDETDWNTEILGEMAGGEANKGFLGCWDLSFHKTIPLLLTGIPVKRPWEIFAYLPFGGWNERLGTPELMQCQNTGLNSMGRFPPS